MQLYVASVALVKTVEGDYLHRQEDKTMYLVTGASGFIPKSAVAALKASGKKVRILARDPSKAGGGVETVAGDLAKPETLKAAFEGVEAMLLVTAASPQLVELHKNALAAAQKAGVKKIVRVSAWGSAKDSPVALGRWHGELDDLFSKSHSNYVALCPHGFMQNIFGYAPAIKNDGAFYAPLGQGRVCYLDSRDIGAVAAKVLESSAWDGKSLELTGPNAFSYDDLARELSAVLEKQVTYVDVPPSAAREAMLGNGLPEWLVSDLLTLSKFYSQNAASTPTPAIREVLGRDPTSLAAFLREHRAYFG